MISEPPAMPQLLANEECPEVPYAESMLAWFALCQDHPWLAVHCNYPMTEPIPPRPMQAAELLALVGSLRNETHSRILLDLLLDLLAPAIIELIQELKTRGDI